VIRDAFAHQRRQCGRLDTLCGQGETLPLLSAAHEKMLFEEIDILNIKLDS
jgi:hypothetical protein